MIAKATVRKIVLQRLIEIVMKIILLFKQEMFIEFLSKEAYKFTSQGSRKTLQRKDIGMRVIIFIFGFQNRLYIKKIIDLRSSS